MTPAQKHQFLNQLKEGVSRTRAATSVGLTNSGVIKAMQEDARFADDVQQVLALRNDDVEEALYKKAVGHTDENGNHHPGSVEAMKFWLVNRAGADWANRSTVEHTGKDGGPIQLATQARLALVAVLTAPETRELAVDFIDTQLAPTKPLELESGG